MLLDRAMLAVSGCELQNHHSQRAAIPVAKSDPITGRSFVGGNPGGMRSYTMSASLFFAVYVANEIYEDVPT
jgi:hypothetical protein